MRQPTIRWCGERSGHAELIEQTLLPLRFEYLEVRDETVMWDAIKRLAIRGAPAIGVAAAYGVVLGVQNFEGDDTGAFEARFNEVCDYLATSRPTAVNLFWALDEMRKVQAQRAQAGDSVSQQLDALFERACSIHEHDEKTCRLLGEHGSRLIAEGDTLMTHCNAGALATGGQGTALSVMFSAKDAGKSFRVFVDETRPLLQGARLSAWELMQADIPATLICDNMAGHVMKTQGVSRIFVGADRIAANGDAANKIGTYSLAVLAKAHGVPFYVVAPKSTFDLSLASGDLIPIEERAAEEITEGFGTRTAPEGVETFSPAFDVTPAELITGIVTEFGLIERPNTQSVAAMLGA